MFVCSRHQAWVNKEGFFPPLLFLQTACVAAVFLPSISQTITLCVTFLDAMFEASTSIGSRVPQNRKVAQTRPFKRNGPIFRDTKNIPSPPLHSRVARPIKKRSERMFATRVPARHGWRRSLNQMQRMEPSFPPLFGSVASVPNFHSFFTLVN